MNHGLCVYQLMNHVRGVDNRLSLPRRSQELGHISDLVHVQQRRQDHCKVCLLKWPDGRGTIKAL